MFSTQVLETKADNVWSQSVHLHDRGTVSLPQQEQNDDDNEGTFGEPDVMTEKPSDSPPVGRKLSR